MNTELVWIPSQLYRIKGRVVAALRLMAPFTPPLHTATDVAMTEEGGVSTPVTLSPAHSPLLLPGDPALDPALLPSPLTAMEAIGEVAPVMAQINVPTPAILQVRGAKHLLSTGMEDP